MSSAASPEPESTSSGEEGGEDWCKEDITTMYLFSDVHECMYVCTGCTWVMFMCMCVHMYNVCSIEDDCQLKLYKLKEHSSP